MKKIIWIFFFAFLCVHSYSQNLDLIVTTKGDSIACRIDNITDTHIYFEMKFNRQWIYTNCNIDSISFYKLKAISKKQLIFRPGSSYIVPFDKLPPDEKINVSISFPSFSLLGPKYDLESSMTSAGLDDEDYVFFSGLKSHPYTSRSITFDFEVTYHLWEKSGISLNMGLIDNINVYGYGIFSGELGGDYGNEMTLNSEIWSVSLNYVYYSKNKRHYIFIGPSYFIHSTQGNINDMNLPINKYEKLGFCLGYSYQMIQKKAWFLMLKTNYRWVPASEIGPFVYQYYSAPYTIEFASTKANLGCFNIGISVGVRIGRKQF